MFPVCYCCKLLILISTPPGYSCKGKDPPDAEDPIESEEEESQTEYHREKVRKKVSLTSFKKYHNIFFPECRYKNNEGNRKLACKYKLNLKKLELFADF
jgi:hypothetical protein